MKYRKEDELLDELNCEELSVMEKKAVDDKRENIEELKHNKECHLR